MTILFFIGFCSVQMQKKAAKNVPIKMPWEAAGSHGSTVSSQPSKPTSMKDSSIAKTGVGNYYGQLKPKLPALETGSPSPVTDMKKQQSSYPQDSKVICCYGLVDCIIILLMASIVVTRRTM